MGSSNKTSDVEELQERLETLEERAVFRDELNEHGEEATGGRRDFLQVLGLGGLAAGMGGGAGYAARSAVEPASAQSASDGDGDIGTPSNPVDVFGDGISATSVSTDEQSRTFYTSPKGSDGAAIQSALDDAAATSGWTRVVVDPIDTAPYVVGANAPLTVPSKTVVEIREHVQLAGSTQENVFQNQNHFDDAVEDTDIWFFGNGGLVDGNKANNTERSSDSTGYGIGSKQNGISLIGVTNAVVQDVDVRDCVLHGIGVMGADGVFIRDNYTNGNRYAGVHSHWRMTDNRRNQNFLITNNLIEDGGQNAGESAGVYASGALDHTINGNVIDTRDNYGISVAGKVSTCSNITVSDNIVRDVAATTTYDPASAIRLWTSGANLDNVQVTGNTIDTAGAVANDQFGIGVDTSGTDTISRLSVTGNTVRTHAMCISLRGDGGYIEDFSIANNEVINFDFSFAKGIEVRDVKEGQISDNVISECQGSGIIVETNGTTAAKIGVYDNLSYDNGQGGNSSDQYGIRLLGPDDVTLIGNRCWSNGSQTYGIYSDTGTSDTVALLNDLRGNSTAGHSLNGSGTITDAVGQGTAEDWNVT